MPQVPTPVVAGDLLFVCARRGVVSCYDVATGKQHWRERIGGDLPQLADSHRQPHLLLSREGEVVVLAADKEFKVLARNTLDEPCIATPAVANDRLYVRTEATLVCIGNPTAK